jgi:hypothetical protein
MNAIRKSIAVFVCCAVLPAADKQPTYSGKYSGGSLQNLQPGADMGLSFGAHSIWIVTRHDKPRMIPPSAVTDISYGQEVHRRIGAAIGLGIASFGLGALLALSKSKKHYVGIVWNDESNGDRGGLVMQADKNEFRGIIAGLEGLTGKTAVSTDTGRPPS